MQFRRWVKNVDRKARETRMFIRAMQSGGHPILAQVVPIRRCNLDCAYCNEYDKIPTRSLQMKCCAGSIIWHAWEPPSSR